MASKNYDSAKKIVAAKKALFFQFAIFLIVISFLFIINLLTSREHFWFIYPLLGWGLALLTQYSVLFGLEKRQSNQNQYEEEPEREAAQENQDYFEPEPEDKLELKEFKKLRKDYNDSDFV